MCLLIGPRPVQTSIFEIDLHLWKWPATGYKIQSPLESCHTEWTPSTSQQEKPLDQPPTYRQVAVDSLPVYKEIWYSTKYLSKLALLRGCPTARTHLWSPLADYDTAVTQKWQFKAFVAQWQHDAKVSRAKQWKRTYCFSMKGAVESLLSYVSFRNDVMRCEEGDECPLHGIEGCFCYEYVFAGRICILNLVPVIEGWYCRVLRYQAGSWGSWVTILCAMTGLDIPRSLLTAMKAIFDKL